MARGLLKTIGTVGKLGTFNRFAIPFAVLMGVASDPALASVNGVPWKDLDENQPHCDRALQLDGGAEAFFEIANAVPGQSEYNAMIAQYRKHQWTELDRAMKVFRKSFETSPLIEAATFLEVQSKLQRIDKEDPSAQKEAERALRDALLLYPKSAMAPAVTAATAGMYLRLGRYQRALALFETALVTYKDDAYRCLFRFGTGETYFLLRDWKEAERHLAHVITSCKANRLRYGAEIRLAEARWLRDSANAEKDLEKVVDAYTPWVEKFHQNTLYNLGEVKYRQKAYPEARFYFNQYLKFEPDRQFVCVPYALKRLADIAYATGDSPESVIGKYLTVRELVPFSEVARFAYLHALLIDLDATNPVEQKRRIKVVDDNIDTIKDTKLRARLYLEKGIALLAAGEGTSLGYLERMSVKARAPLQKGDLSNFVNKRVAELLESGKVRLDPDRAEVASPLDMAFTPVEEGYRKWLIGTPQAGRIEAYYARRMADLIAKDIAAGDWDGGLAKATRWKSSGLWPQSGIDRDARHVVAFAILKSLLDAPDPSQTAAIAVTRKNSIWGEFYGNDFAVTDKLAALRLGDMPRVEALSSDRRPASVDGATPPDTRPYLWLAHARVLTSLKRYADAEKALTNVSWADLNDEVSDEKVKIYRETGRFDKAFETVKDRYKATTGDDRKKALFEAAKIVGEGKLWLRGPDLLGAVRAVGLKGKEIAPFLYLAGRSYSELQDCPESIGSYESALKEDDQAPEAHEARFRLGKCLAKEKRLDAARKQWEQVVKSKDAFWSPLASNEIKVLTP